jgi:hypothetical protein
MGLLEVLGQSRDYVHTAVDDLESFVWVLLWAVLEKLDEISTLSDIEQDFFDILHSSDIYYLQNRGNFARRLLVNDPSPGFSVFTDLLFTWLEMAPKFFVEVTKKKRNHPLPKEYYQPIYKAYLKVGFEAVERMDERWSYAHSQQLTPQ